MEEGRSAQPFGADCDGLVALIGTYLSLFESGVWLLGFPEIPSLESTAT